MMFVMLHSLASIIIQFLLMCNCGQAQCESIFFFLKFIESSKIKYCETCLIQPYHNSYNQVNLHKPASFCGPTQCFFFVVVAVFF